MPWENDHAGAFYHDIDDDDMQIEANGDFEVLLSTERPAGYSGNWLKIEPGARVLMTRYRSYDWEHEIDPVMSIECLNPTGLKKRLTPDDILERIDHMARMPVRATKLFYAMQNQMKHERRGQRVRTGPYRVGPSPSRSICRQCSSSKMARL